MFVGFVPLVLSRSIFTQPSQESFVAIAIGVRANIRVAQMMPRTKTNTVRKIMPKTKASTINNMMSSKRSGTRTHFTLAHSPDLN